MSITIHEICEELESFSEVDLLEILDINSEELVARFRDKIEDNYEYLKSELIKEEDDDLL